MNETIIILFMLVACVGILLYFVGWVNTIFMALGKNEKLMATFIFFFGPLGIYYGIKNWNEAKTQVKQIVIGISVMCATIIPAYIYYSNNIIK